ncbi:MAG: branched-chain amino acid ABC transporter substrate-binding protein [Desulfarculus sp.]|jgi:branched-chain amino acid transport system substrate-binding protein|nr:MAG: branched-chain amino acid ABC transporter substrate-binding protein [Desulfarculus sp.]
MKFRRAGIILLTLALALTLGLAAPGMAAQEFTFGCAVPLSGLFGKDGQLVRDAYTFWMETINARGGIAGKYKVRIIFYDDQSDPQTSAKLVERLVTQDKVDLLLGGFGSSQVMAASAAAERHKFPYLSGGASSNKLYERGARYYFGTLGKATEEVRGCVDVFTSVTPRPKTVAIVGANIPFTAESCKGYKLYAEKYGFKVVHYELFPISLKDYNTMLLKAKAKKPDVLLVGSHLAVAMRVVKAMKEIDFNPKGVAFSYGPTVPAFVQGLKADANYVFAASEWTPNLPYKGPVFGSARQFNQAYRQRFRRSPDYVEAASTAAAVVQQVAMEQLGLKPRVTAADRVRLMEKLHQIDLMTFYGPIHFGKSGANREHPPVAVQVQNGQLINVYPAKWAEKPPIYPTPAWNKR